MNRPWHRRYHSDALTGYMALSLEERGAYTTILDMLYDCGEPIVDNERYLAGCMSCSLRKYRSVRDSLAEKGKITLTENGRITNSRFEKEREKDASFSRKQTENGSKPKDNSAETDKNVNKNNKSQKPNDNPHARSTSTSIARKRKKEVSPSPLRSDDDRQPNLKVVDRRDREPSEYAFEAGVIRLNQGDLEKWRKAYPDIAVESELFALAEWAGRQKNWFPAVSGALAKRQREALEQKVRIAEEVKVRALHPPPQHVCKVAL